MKPTRNINRTRAAAFTLVELLVVVAILGVLMSLSIPAYKKAAKKDPLSIGVQQLIDDLEWARIHAMARGSDVCVVFFPLWSQVAATTVNQQSYFRPDANTLPSVLPSTANELLGGQLASYALFAEGSAGEQPGQLVVEQTFLTKWKQLPMGVVIPSGTFNNTVLFPRTLDAKLLRLSNDDTNLPTADVISLPAIRFRGQGDLKPDPNRPNSTSLVLVLEYYGPDLLYPTRDVSGLYKERYATVDAYVPSPTSDTRKATNEISVLTGRSKLIGIKR